MSRRGEFNRFNSLLSINFLSCALFLSFMTAGCSQRAKLVRGLEAETVTERLHSLEELGLMGTRARKALPQVMDMLAEDEDMSIRRAATRVIGRIGSKDRAEATRALLRALDDQDSVMRRVAVVALGDLRPFPTGAFSALIVAMGDPDPMVSELALSTLLDYVPHCNHALRLALGDEEPGVRRMAAKALGCLGYEAKFALGALRRALEDPDHNVRREAELALDRINGGAGAVEGRL